MERYMITAISLETHSELSLTIEADEGETTDGIILTTHIAGVAISAKNHGYFQAFQELRDALLQHGYGLKCAGSKLNALQSGMASGTNKIYIVTLGQQALRKDLISLYDYADANEFPNSESQNDFAKQWFDSLKHRTE
jgi:hypothetical protein